MIKVNVHIDGGAQQAEAMNPWVCTYPWVCRVCIHWLRGWLLASERLGGLQQSIDRQIHFFIRVRSQDRLCSFLHSTLWNQRVYERQKIQYFTNPAGCQTNREEALHHLIFKRLTQTRRSTSLMRKQSIVARYI